MVKLVFYHKRSAKRKKRRRIILARICIIDIHNHNYNAVLSRLDSRQEGLCWLCSKRINDQEIIVSKVNGKRSKYFHKECAERIHLL
jgi:hypothetical protein